MELFFFYIETLLSLNDLFNIELFWHLTVCKQNLFLYLIELAELELLD